MDVLWLHSAAPYDVFTGPAKAMAGAGDVSAGSHEYGFFGRSFFLSSFDFSSEDSVRGTRTQR